MVTATRTLCPIEQSGSVEDAWTGTIRNIEGDIGAHVYLAERGAAELRVGREDRCEGPSRLTGSTATA